MLIKGFIFRKLGSIYSFCTLKLKVGNADDFLDVKIEMLGVPRNGFSVHSQVLKGWLGR